MTLVTFDFHNTIAYCDPWFDLEIRTLPAQVAVSLAPDLDPADVTVSYRALRQGVMRSGIEIDAYDGVESVLRGHGAAVDRDDIETEVDRLMREALAHVRAVPGVRDVIVGLASEGHRLGVVSSAVHHDFLEWTLDHLGIMASFDFVLSSARAGFYKSHPGIYEEALRLGSAKAEKALHIGDSPRWDIEAASAVGMRTVWLSHGDSSHLADVVPSLSIPSFEGALPAILDLAAGVRT
jgi:HAD superfamily hydrolase (TIGR01509 family)